MQKKNAYIEKNINILDLDKSIVEVFRKNDIVTIEQLWVFHYPLNQVLLTFFYLIPKAALS